MRIAWKLESEDPFHFICSSNPYSELSGRWSGIIIKKKKIKKNHKLSSVDSIERPRETE